MNLYTIFLENDWVVKTMIVAAIVTTLIILEKLYQFYISYQALQELKSMQNISEIEQLKSSQLKDILANISSFEGERRELFDANVGVHLDIYESYLMRYIPIIGLIAILAPMLGLIGTFLGVSHVFDGVSQVSLSDPAIIARGIRGVLIDTLSGLMVAVYAMIFYKAFEIYVQKIIMKFEAQLYKLLKEK